MYVLEINPLSAASFANIFTHSMGCLCFVYGFLCCAKTLSLIRSHLFIFVFIVLALGGESEKVVLQFMSESVQPMFSSKSFIVSGLILLVL